MLLEEFSSQLVLVLMLAVPLTSRLGTGRLLVEV
jgi:hypothetical protein